MLRVPDFAEH